MKRLQTIHLLDTDQSDPLIEIHVFGAKWMGDDGNQWGVSGRGETVDAALQGFASALVEAIAQGHG